jgi:hypothetical protein
VSTIPALQAAHRARAWAWWLLPAVALGALIGWETDWGRHLLRVPAAPAPVTSRPVESSVLPEYRLEGGIAARSETVSRTLFNPTRRPAPVLATEGGGPRRIQPGQFQLVGTTVSGDRNVAFLKEAGGGKAHTVRQGDEINGIRVALVAPDRVRLTAGDDTEELVLKVARGPKTTLAVAPPPAGPAAVNTGQAAPAGATAAQGAQQPAQPTGANVAPSQAAVRRANRRGTPPGQSVQDAGAAQSDATTGTAQPPGNAQAPGTWDSTYQNMQQQRRQ